MKFIDARDTALVLVDYQQRLMPAIHGGADAGERRNGNRCGERDDTLALHEVAQTVG